MYQKYQKFSRLSAALLLVLTSCHGAAASYPVTVTDDRNKQVTLAKQPVSVASVSVFGADLLSALGMRASGISTLNHQQPKFLGEQIKQMADLGEIHETNFELLTTLAPDLTIGLRHYTEPFAGQFEKVGQFLAYDLVTYEDSERAILSAGTALGKAEAATRLNQQFGAKLQQFSQQAPGGLTAVFLWHWADVPYGFFDHHLTMQLMQQLKVKNLLGASPQPEIKKFDSAPVTMETLLKLDPDVILSFKGEAGPFINHPAWQQLKAVKNGRAFQVSEQYVMPHGPIARDMVLRELAALFYPKQFSQPTDIPAPARAIPMRFAK